MAKGGNSTLPITDDMFDVAVARYALTGLKNKSCEGAGFKWNSLFQIFRNGLNPEWEERWNEAEEMYRESLIEAAHDRAVNGVEEPIIGGKDRDEIVTHVTRYSDRLMERMLEAKGGPEFSPKMRVDHYTQEPPFDLTILTQAERDRVRYLMSQIRDIINSRIVYRQAVAEGQSPDPPQLPAP